MQLLLTLFLVAAVLVGVLHSHNIIPKRADVALAELQDEAYVISIAALPAPEDEVRVVAFSLFGNDRKYTYGAVKNAELAKLYYPGWVVRFYVGDEVNPIVVSALTERGAEVLPIPAGHPANFGMLWRFTVADDARVHRFVVRDVDSRLNYRERFAVEEWVQSGKAVHVMRDHPYHSAPVMGGMWGAVRGALPNMTQQLLQWADKSSFATDMRFLEEVYWESHMRRQSLAHDAFYCDIYHDSETRPFPTPRNVLFEHVGQVFDYKERPYPEAIVRNSKEKECRQRDAPEEDEGGGEEVRV